MSTKERGLFRLIFKNFIKSITPKIPKTTLVGEDYYGTKYFEVINENSDRRPCRRYFEPVNKTDFEQEIPAEWEAWLRYRRGSPPTEAEVNEGYHMIISKRKKAAEIKATFTKPVDPDSLTVNEKPPLQHTSQNFPVYEEYKNQGSDYKKR